MSLQCYQNAPARTPIPLAGGELERIAGRVADDSRCSGDERALAQAVLAARAPPEAHAQALPHNKRGPCLAPIPTKGFVFRFRGFLQCVRAILLQIFIKKSNRKTELPAIALGAT
jgi:hypothetical protein